MSRLDVLRRVLAAFAAVTTLPYLGLKAHWLLGGRSGLVDPEFGRSTSMQVLNLLTAALDVVALVLAVVLFRGLRAPARLLLPPMWVGAGLLGQILVAFPVILLTQSGPTSPPDGSVPPLADWVYLLVYGGFAGLGLGLLGAFAVHAWQRWGHLTPTAATGMQRGWLLVAAGLALASALATLSLSPQPALTRAMDAVVALLAAGSLAVLSRSPAARPGRTCVVVAFVTTGAMAAWGTYQMVLRTIPNELIGTAAPGTGEVTESAVRLVAGIVGGVALALRGRRAPVQG